MTATNNKMDSLAELKDVLLQEINLYERYAEQLKGDTDLMARLKVEELEASNKAKATLLLKIQTVEKARQQVVRKIAQEKGIQEDQVKITDLCKTLNEKDGGVLLSLRERLQKAVQSIRFLQEDAGALVMASVRWIDGSMANLKRLLTPTGTYNSRGRVDHPEVFAGRVVENKA